MLHFFMVLLGILEGLCGILLVAIILLQKSRSHGAAAGLAFGAGMGESLFGAQATNILQKITVWLATIFLVNTTLLAVLGSRSHRGGGQSVTDGIPAARPPIEAPAGGPMAPVGGPLSGADQMPLAAPAPAAEPVKSDVPASAATPAPAADAGQQPAQP